MAYPNPFQKNHVSQDAMDEDEDDDLKINASKASKATTEREKKFEKFKKLQTNPISTETLSRNNNKNSSKTKRKKCKKRANSLPRNVIDDDNKNDYIFFDDKQRIKPIKCSLKNLKSNQFDALNLETSTLNVSNSLQFKFDALSNSKNLEIQTACYRSIRVPGHRMVHIRRMWKDICSPIIKQLKLQIRMNSKKNLIELRMINGGDLDDGLKGKNVIQKGSDFVRATVLGFEIKDSLALIRMDDIYLESFDIRDVKFFNKKSDHWMRAIGRIAGQYGKIKYSIENSTNTRIVIFGFKVHILGSFSSIRLARNAISRLVIGSSPGNVYAKLRVVSNKLKHKF